MRRRRQAIGAIDDLMRLQLAVCEVYSPKPLALPNPCRMSHTWICLAPAHAASASTAMRVARTLHIVIACVFFSPLPLRSVYEQTGQHLEL